MEMAGTMDKHAGDAGKWMMARLDTLPLSRFHYKMLVVNGFAWAFDAFDVGLVTFVVTALVSSWQLSAEQVGILLSSGMAGMIIGAFLSGPLADRFGRKAVFQWTMLIFSLFSLLCAVAWNFWSLVVFRFFVGLGLGGETPVVTALLGEFVPAGDRGKVQGLLNCFWAIGWLAAAAVAFFLIPAVGWRWAFVAGALPALYVWMIRLHVPESPRWLILRGRLEEARTIVAGIEQIVGRTAKIPPVSAADIAKVIEPKASSFADLFAGIYLKRTIMLWLLWFLAMFGYYGLFSWMPTLLVKAGHSMVKSFEYVFFLQCAYLPNQIISAYLMDKFGRKWPLVINLLFAGVATVIFGLALGSNLSMGQVLLLGLLTSFFVSGIWGITYTYTPELYPTGIRVTGTSWAATCSRFGSMLAPLIVGYSLDSLGVGGVYGIIAIAFIAAGMVVWGLGVETRGKQL
ncbi:MFS transporter, putative metabolite:H+ symporter [Dendrosporobacter quercicolus]|uniref:MFS transporter, putative metabolite:H+ symporter n=2 Tax=Dendrosporobacter quercicolus TaxID=146817 RepID=A0A1G9QKT8_9FIRM|nr:MFS transporter, putative metabolite:H+ symporter [Dendrosporobacter quercicolus]